jgi:hypothetical protein
MTAYNSTHFDPPAPVASVSLINEVTGESLSDILMQLDTRADVTLIPQEAARLLDLALSETQYELISFDGTRSTTAAVQLKMQLGRYTFRGKYLLIDQSVGVISRDILNLVSILFDGPQLAWTEYRITKNNA